MRPSYFDSTTKTGFAVVTYTTVITLSKISGLLSSGFMSWSCYEINWVTHCHWLLPRYIIRIDRVAKS